MPFKSDTIKLPPEYDRRRKLSDEQKDEIKHKYETGFYSLMKLAREYNVSKKLILLIVNPESKRKSDERAKEHWRDYIPSKEEAARIKREWRQYKHGLHQMGIIGNKEEQA